MQSKKRLLAAGFSILAVVALTATFFVSYGFARAANPNSNSYTIGNNTPGFIKNATDAGAVDPSTVISVTVWLNLHNENKLDQLVQQQNQNGNANYHKWLNQGQFDANFSPTAQEVNSVQNFLSAHKLTVLDVAENNWYVEVQGTVGDIEKAFHVQIDNYNLDGVTYRSNTGNPNVNDASGAHIAAISGMDDYGYQPTLVYPSNPDGTTASPQSVPVGSNGLVFEGQCFAQGVQTQTFTSTGVTATYTGNRYGSDITNTTLGHIAPCGYQPSELQSAYDMNPLYSAGLDGSGQTVVITDAFGSPTIAQDAEAFSQIYGLPDLTSANFQIIQAPGSLNNKVNNTKHFGPNNWPGEITLDVEWVHAMAPGAKIDLVISPNNGSDLDEAVNYAVVHHLGNTISNSWSGLEGFGNPSEFNRVNRILEQAAAEGIDVNFSSGDSGDNTTQVGFKTVGFPGSSPFATSIGGTSLSLTSNDTIDFQTGWGNNITRIAEPIAQGSPPNDPPLHLGFQFGAGGGASLTFAKPSWQSALPGTTRQVPDVSMLADPQTGVEIINVDTANPGFVNVSVIGGTSLACPMFSAIMAIASEKAGSGLGQAAPLMYNLPAGAVTDVTAVSSPNNVTGSITDSSGTTNYSADQLAAPLDGVTSYYSALYNSPFSTRWFVLTFGTDTSLTTGPGWDNVTGVGTPDGFNFVNALAP
ncbi:MAG TPA: S53 family peptidase [Ktedonobacterales bacterium]|nr:S53 family peptidase [Ktedonobacterales bacterium]